MAVVLENSYLNTNSNVTTLDVTSVAVPTSSNRAIYVRIGSVTTAVDDGEFATAVAWDVAGVDEAFTLLGEAQNEQSTVAIWRLTAPTEQTAIVTVTYNSTDATDLGTVVRVEVLSGVDQGTPEDSWQTPSEGTGSPQTHTVNTASGDYCMDLVCQRDTAQDNDFVENGPGTEDFNNQFDEIDVAGATFVATGSTVAFGWTTPFTDDWAMAGVSINPSTSTIVTRVFRSRR